MASSNPIVRKAVNAQENTLKVSLLIGNGFDIGVGLKTKYIDFIKSYVVKSSPDNSTIAKLKEKIKQGDLDWGDAEYAFGQLDFAEIGNGVESAYRESLHDFQIALENYLSSESLRLTFPEKAHAILRESLLKSIIEIVALPNNGSFLSKKTAVRLSIINFNYTDTVDRIVGGIESADVNNSGNVVRVYIDSIVHAHGKLGSDILFGVDNADQIKSQTLRLLSEEEGYLVKPARAEIGNCKFYKDAKTILNGSDVLVLFGLSYGKTDMTWWDDIASRIIYDTNRARCEVILCPYTTDPIDVHTIDDERYVKRQERERFFSNFSGRMHNAVRVDRSALKRIHVIGYGPYNDWLSNNRYYCDPLRLHSIGVRCVTDYDGKPITKARYP